MYEINMQDFLLSTNSSSSSCHKYGKWNHQKLASKVCEANKIEKNSHISQEQLNKKNKQQERVDSFKKYTEFMNAQNSIITQILVDKSNKSSFEEELISRLRDSSNQFIKNILNELADAYSKLKTLKTTSDQKIKLLESQLQQTKQQNKLLRQQFYCEWQQKSEKCGQLLKFMQRQLQSTTQQYENRISCLIQQLQQKHRNYDELLSQKLQISNQLMQANRLLRIQREDLNQKRKQFKGMELLIQQYQTVITQYQRQILGRNQKIKELETNNVKLQQTNKSSLSKIQQFVQNINKLTEEISMNKAMIQQLKIQIINNQKEFQTKKKQFESQLKVQINNIASIKNNQDKLKQSLKQTMQKHTNMQKNIIQSNQKMLKYEEIIKQQKYQTKERIEKIQKMFKKKQKIIKKAVNSKLKDLKAKNEQLKQHIQRQMFKFYHQSKMQFLINSS